MAPWLCLMMYAPGIVAHFLHRARANKFTKIAISLNNTELPHEFDLQPMSSKETDDKYSELILSGEDWQRRVIVILPDYECDAPNPEVRKYAEKCLKYELSFGERAIGKGNILLRLKSKQNVNLARIITKQPQKTQFLIQVPFFSPRENHAKWRSEAHFHADDSDEECEEDDTWLWWHNFHRLSGFQSNIKLVLELNIRQIPTKENIQRWLSEPIEAIIIPTSFFNYDELDGSLQLCKDWQPAMLHFIRARLNIIIQTTAEEGQYWIDYADYIYDYQCEFAGSDEFGISYDEKDGLTVPLQTVHMNVDFMLYEEFETDDTKYILYFKAIRDALTDRAPPNDVTVITLLGAGRGPLINAILFASEDTRRQVRLYVIEKNCSAISTLKYKIEKMWPNKDVHLYCKDMRDFTPPEKADMLVSELLGSFGDNELSPECLDCAKRFLKVSGISIPNSSTSFIHPVMAPTYPNKIDKYYKLHHNRYITFESTYITLMRNVYHIDEPKELWKFEHPNFEPETNDNTRYNVLKFKADFNCVMNGIAGAFESALYKEHKLSIRRLQHTPDLISWFPIYFPLSKPMNIKDGDEIEIHFWRHVNAYQVWYEWAVKSPQITHVHNFQGRYSPIYLK